MSFPSIPIQAQPASTFLHRLATETRLQIIEEVLCGETISSKYRARYPPNHIMALSQVSRACRYEFLDVLHKVAAVALRTGDILCLDGNYSIFDRSRLERIELSERCVGTPTSDITIIAGMQHCLEVCPRLKQMTLTHLPGYFFEGAGPFRDPPRGQTQVPKLVRELDDDPWPLVLGVLVCRALEACPRGKDIEVIIEIDLALLSGSYEVHNKAFGKLKIDVALKQIVWKYKGEECKVCDIDSNNEKALQVMYNKKSRIVS